MASNAACGNNLVAGEVVVAAANNENGKNDENQSKVVVAMREEDGNKNVDYSQRGQWLRAALLGANDGLVSVASLMMGVGAVKRDSKAMLLAGLVGCIAGACSMALGEYVSVSTQYEVEVAQIKRDMVIMMKNKNEMEKKRRSLLPNPLHAALASALSFTVGAVIPLVFTAFVRDYKLRLVLCVVVSSLSLVGFGCLGAELGHTHKVKSSIRVLIGGLLAMAITFGLTKLVGFSANLEL